ncbi:hypothetical protein [Pseudonocardia nigra]|uniref:hypothetical protein n=1 Tax=Pseudonocardia nigra TaxID=1921578 RepID=UPI001C5D4A97|nr:hypothetical protein [Pseudonocardia nigra]
MSAALVRRAARYEAATWRSLARWLLRRPDVGPADTGFAYRGPQVAPMLVMLAVSMIDVVAVDLLVPWPWLRPVLLVIGVWGTLEVLGMLAAITIHPHVVGAAGLRIRNGVSLDVHIPWDAVAGVRRVRRTRDGRGVQLDGSTLHVVVADQTTVEVTLARPLPVTLPRNRTAEITEVRLHADDAAGFVAAARARVAAGS